MDNQCWSVHFDIKCASPVALVPIYQIPVTFVLIACSSLHFLSSGHLLREAHGTDRQKSFYLNEVCFSLKCAVEFGAN